MNDILDLLKETRILGCKLANTPIDPSKRLGKEKDSATIDRGRYRKLMGRLIYFSHTRPNIGFPVSVVSQFIHDQTEQYMKLYTRS